MKLTPYVLMQSQKHYLKGFDDPKVQAFFNRIPKGYGNVKTKLVGAPLSGQQLDEYLQFMEEYLRKKIWKTLINIRKPYTKERVSELLQIVKQADVITVSDDTYQFACLLNNWVKFMVKTMSEDAEKEFRKFPSSDNFFKWMGTLRMVDVIGCNEASFPESFAPHLSILLCKSFILFEYPLISALL